MNIFEQQKANRKDTVYLIFIIILFLSAVGFGYDYFILKIDPFHLFESSPQSIRSNVPVGTLGALLLSILMSLYSYFCGDFFVLKSCGACLLSTKAEKNFSEKQLENIVDEMTIASGLPRPKLYIVEDPDPNAFATGRDPKHASIAVTRGLLEKLNREEVQGVIAHEMSHVQNFDIRYMCVVAVLIGAAVLAADWARRSLFYGRRGRSSSDRKGGGAALFFVIWVILIILTPILGQIMAMCVSRKREYLADASGAQLTRNPIGLAKALEKIEQAAEPTLSIKKGTAHLCISDPLGKTMGLKEGFWADLLSTHPPISERIKKLKEMAYLYS